MLLDLEDKTPSEFFQTSINVFKQKNINEKKKRKKFPKIKKKKKKKSKNSKKFFFEFFLQNYEK